MAKSYEPNRPFMFNSAIDMDRMRLAYEAGIMPALFDAIRCHRLYNVPVDHPCPEWIWDGVTKVLEERLREGKVIGKGKTGNESAKYESDMMHYYRWEAVKEARKNGFKGHKAFEKAHEMLKNGFAQGSPDTIENSQKMVNAVLNNDEGQKRFYLASFPATRAAGLN